MHHKRIAITTSIGSDVVSAHHNKTVECPPEVSVSSTRVDGHSLFVCQSRKKPAMCFDDLQNVKLLQSAHCYFAHLRAQMENRLCFAATLSISENVWKTDFASRSLSTMNLSMPYAKSVTQMYDHKPEVSAGSQAHAQRVASWCSFRGETKPHREREHMWHNHKIYGVLHNQNRCKHVYSVPIVSQIQKCLNVLCMARCSVIPWLDRLGASREVGEFPCVMWLCVVVPIVHSNLAH